MLVSNRGPDPEFTRVTGATRGYPGLVAWISEARFRTLVLYCSTSAEIPENLQKPKENQCFWWFQPLDMRPFWGPTWGAKGVHPAAFGRPQTFKICEWSMVFEHFCF